MRSLLRNTTLALAVAITAGVFSSAASADWWDENNYPDWWLKDVGNARWFAKQNHCSWNASFGEGPVFDGPVGDGRYYTGPYRGPFARLATPDEAQCLMKCEARPARYGGYQYFTVRICRGHDGVVTRRARRVDVELK
jgi:hypothetical protein